MNHGPAELAPGAAPGGGPTRPAAPTPQAVMNGEPLRRTVTIKDPQGLHMRPAAAFAKLARQFRSAVTVRREDRSVNGKSQLDLLLLAAEPGAELILEVSGEDAPDALAALGDALEAVCCAEEAGDDLPPPKG